MGAATYTNEEGRPTTEVAGTPLHLRQGVSPTSNAEPNNSTARPTTATGTSPVIGTRLVLEQLLAAMPVPTGRVLRQAVPDLPGAFLYRSATRRGQMLTFVFVRDGIAAEWRLNDRVVRIWYEASESEVGAERHHIFRFHQSSPRAELLREISAHGVQGWFGRRGMRGVFDELVQLAWFAGQPRTEVRAS